MLKLCQILSRSPSIGHLMFLPISSLHVHFLIIFLTSLGSLKDSSILTLILRQIYSFSWAYVKEYVYLNIMHLKVKEHT
jgi:hypothetical protein